MKVTDPERSLVDGFRRTALCGGIEELITSASGFPLLDLDLLIKILRCYDSPWLWAAKGWFLERFRQTFHIEDSILLEIEKHRPKSPRYLERNQRGGTLVSRWNLILPEAII
jgi:predicted transcriptional regulator of viral defense system